MNDRNRNFFIRLAYWLGIGADAIWAVALFFPQLFGILTGRSDFTPDLSTQVIMGMGGSLMAGWTILLIWALRDPIERRFVIILTAFPVVLGMLIISLIEILHGNSFLIWAMIKSLVLIISMTISYVLASKR